MSSTTVFRTPCQSTGCPRTWWRVDLPGGYQLGCGWFGSLEGSGQFQVWITGRTGAELYRRPCGRNPQTVSSLIILYIEMYSHAAPEAVPRSAAG